MESANLKDGKNQVVFILMHCALVLIVYNRVFQKIQNMQCVAIQRMQVVAHYCDQYATKIRVFRSLSNFSHPF